jgi:hypothetical protein
VYLARVALRSSHPLLVDVIHVDVDVIHVFVDLDLVVDLVAVVVVCLEVQTGYIGNKTVRTHG